MICDFFLPVLHLMPYLFLFQIENNEFINNKILIMQRTIPISLQVNKQSNSKCIDFCKTSSIRHCWNSHSGCKLNLFAITHSFRRFGILNLILQSCLFFCLIKFLLMNFFFLLLFVVLHCFISLLEH